MGSNYFRWIVSGPDCTYCGYHPNQSWDHWPPRTFGDYGLLLPACLECNTGLNDRYPTSLNGRITLAKDNIRRRYARFLRMPEWTDREISKLGKTLKSNVVTALAVREKASKRLAWDAVAYLSRIDDINAIAAHSAECEVRMLNAKRFWTRTEPAMETST